MISGNPWVALPSALISHYLLDLVPHKEYAIEHLHKLAKDGRYGWPMIFELFKGMMDAFLAFMVVVWLTDGAFLPFFAALVSVIPDTLHPVDMAFARRYGLPYPQFNENPYLQLPKKNVLTSVLSWQRHFHYKVHLMERDQVPRWLGLLTQGSAALAGITLLVTFAA